MLPFQLVYHPRNGRAVRQAGIDYRVVGGLAVLFHVQSRDPMAARFTKDVELAVNRADLARITQTVRPPGLVHHHVDGLDILVDAVAPKVRSSPGVDEQGFL